MPIILVMRLLTPIIAFCLILAAATAPRAAESVYPVGSGVIATYMPSGTTLVAGDTITVTRLVTNTAPFPLTGLYLSEHLPPGLQAVSATVTVNNVAVIPSATTLPQGTVVAGCTSLYWVISEPGSISLPAGQTLRMTVKLTSTQAGQFTLPLHTLAFLGNGNPFFATGDSVIITVTPRSDTTPPAAIGNLHVQ